MNKNVNKHKYDKQAHSAWLNEWREVHKLPRLSIDADSVAFLDDNAKFIFDRWCRHGVFYKGNKVVSTAIIPCAYVEW